MNIREQINEEFESKFSGWSEISPADPTKILSEAVVGSMEKSELTLLKNTKNMIDSLPSLLGFERKPASYPECIIETSALDKQNKATIPKSPNSLGNELILSETERYNTHVELKHQKETKEGIEIHLSSSKRIQTLSLYWLPHHTKQRPNHSIDIEISPSQKDSETYPIPKYRITDSTNHLSRSGFIHIHFYQKQDVSNLKLIIKNHPPAQKGDIFISVSRCEVYFHKGTLQIGSISSKPWEEVPLPDALVTPPTTVKVKLTETKESTLKVNLAGPNIRSVNQSDKAPTCFYSKTNHSIVFCNMHSLLGNQLTPASIFLGRTKLVPEAEDLKSISRARSLPVLTHLGAPREKRERYLSRFYQCFSEFIEYHNQKEVDLAQLEIALIHQFSELEDVDIYRDPIKKNLTFFVLQRQLTEIQPEVLDNLRNYLDRKLGYLTQYEIHLMKVYRPEIEITFFHKTPGPFLLAQIEKVVLEKIQQEIQKLMRRLKAHSDIETLNISSDSIYKVVKQTISQLCPQHDQREGDIETRIFDPQKKRFDHQIPVQLGVRIFPTQRLNRGEK